LDDEGIIGAISFRNHNVIFTDRLEAVLPVVLGEGIGKVVAWLAAIPP
jgi:hypothetical protein